jgi:hypothetical protein
MLELPDVSSYVSNTSIAQHVSANLAIIRSIKITGETAALLYTTVTFANTFS